MKNIAALKYKQLSEAKKATIWFVICSFIQRGITVLTTPIFTRLLSTEEYGQYSVFSSWLELLTVLVTLRLYHGIYMRNLVKYPERRDSYSSSLIWLTTILVGIWFVVYITFHHFFNSLLALSTPIMICMFSIILTSSAFSFWSSRQRVDFKYRKLITVTIIVSLLKPIISMVLIVIAKNNRVFFWIFGTAIVELIIYGYLYMTQIKKGKTLFNKEFWMEAIKFNIPLVPHYLSQIVLNHSDRIMIQRICGDSSAGLYSLAYSLAMLMVVFNTSLHNTISPWTFQHIKSNSFKKISQMGIATSSLVAGINFLLILVAPEVLAIFAPKTYSEAVFVIPPVAMGVYFMFVYGLSANVEMYYGENIYIMIASICGAVLNVLLNYIFIPRYGYIAAAYTTLVSYVVYCFMHAVFCNHICKKENVPGHIFNYRIMLGMSVLFVISSFIAMFAYNFALLRYSLLCGIIIIIGMNRKKLLPKFREYIKI